MKTTPSTSLLKTELAAVAQLAMHLIVSEFKAMTLNLRECMHEAQYGYYIGGCSPPSPPTNRIIDEYPHGTVGSLLTYRCNSGYIPHLQRSDCMAN